MPIAVDIMKQVKQEKRAFDKYQEAVQKARKKGRKRPRRGLSPPEQQPPTITRFWRKLLAMHAVFPLIVEWTAAAELVIVMVPGSVEEERLFSVMNFLKDDTRNRLSLHLEAAVRIFSQQQYTTATFPYTRAYNVCLRCMSKAGTPRSSCMSKGRCIKE